MGSRSTTRRADGSRTRAPGWWVSLGAGAALLAACSRPLPDAETPAARAYVAQCGICHAAYAPGLLTAAMWEIQVARMDEYRRRRGMPPLGTTDRQVILDYLRAHAG